MVKFLSLEEVYQTKSGSLKQTATLRLSDDLKGKISFASTKPSEVNLEILAKDWSITHNTSTKDSVLKRTWKGGANTKFTLTQKVPKGKLYLIPNPALKIAKKGLVGEHDEMSVEYDALNRRTTGALTMYAGEDKAYKFSVNGNSKAGFEKGTIRAKMLRDTVLHSMSVSGNMDAPVLSVKSRMGSDLKTKVSYEAATKHVSVTAQHKHDSWKNKLSFTSKSNTLTLQSQHKTKISNGHAATTTVTVATPVSSKPNPQATIGVKWDF